MPKKDASNSPLKRSSIEIERDRALVAEYHVKGLSLRKITDELNNRRSVSYTVSTSTVERDYHANIKRWRKVALVPTEADMQEQLLAIRQVKVEAWAAWERSKQDAEQVKEIQELEQILDKNLKPVDAVMVTKQIETLRRGQAGQDKFLKLVIDCIDRESRLKGLYTDKVHVAVDKKEEITHTYKMFGHVSPAMWDMPGIEVIDGVIHKDGVPVQIIEGEVLPVAKSKDI